MDEIIVVHALEGAFAVHDPRRAVCLVAYDQIETGQPQFLGLMDHIDGLVGGEHHVQRVRFGTEPVGHGLRVRGGGERDVGQLAVGFLGDLACLGVRAHHVHVDAPARLVDPVAHRLAHQRNRWREEQHRAASTGVLLAQAQRGHCLAGAAGHDQ